MDEKGDPLYHVKPATWEVAQNDGQRWRWALARAAEIDPGQNGALQHRFAQFLRGLHRESRGDHLLWLQRALANQV